MAMITSIIVLAEEIRRSAARSPALAKLRSRGARSSGTNTRSESRENSWALALSNPLSFWRYLASLFSGDSSTAAAGSVASAVKYIALALVSDPKRLARILATSQ